MHLICFAPTFGSVKALYPCIGITASGTKQLGDDLIDQVLFHFSDRP